MNSGPDMLAATFKMLGALALVLGGLWAVFWMLRRLAASRPSSGRVPLIKVLGSRWLAFKTQVTLVAVPGAILVLGISRERVQLLARLDGVEDASASQVLQDGGGGAFMDLLARMGERHRGTREGCGPQEERG